MRCECADDRAYATQSSTAGYLPSWPTRYSVEGCRLAGVGKITAAWAADLSIRAAQAPSPPAPGCRSPTVPPGCRPPPSPQESMQTTPASLPNPARQRGRRPTPRHAQRAAHLRPTLLNPPRKVLGRTRIRVSESTIHGGTPPPPGARWHTLRKTSGKGLTHRSSWGDWFFASARLATTAYRTNDIAAPRIHAMDGRIALRSGTCYH